MPKTRCPCPDYYWHGTRGCQGSPVQRAGKLDGLCNACIDRRCYIDPVPHPRFDDPAHHEHMAVRAEYEDGG